MNREGIQKVARAVLYEGYMLYPYRASSLKNARRVTFGVLYPAQWAEVYGPTDRSFFHMECLVRGESLTEVVLQVRYLELTSPAGDAIDRELPFAFPLADGLRESFSGGEVAAWANELDRGLFRLTVEVRNTAVLRTLDRDAAMAHSLVSAHAAVSVADGQFISLTDPPADLVGAAAKCSNVGVWPVLVGEKGATDTILASPIILSDYPEVAPESNGDLCDSTEIDEILTLRILTLTDEEKAEVRQSDERARQILERAEAIPAEHLMRLHGTIRGLRPVLQPGDRVRLKPRNNADIFDLALAGQIAVITSIERDFEDKVHVAVVLEDDPGRDLGEMHQIGHRFFFSPEEVEQLS